MFRPFTEEKIVFDPDEETFYLVSKGVIGSPRPFKNIIGFYRDGTFLPASEARVRECMVAKSGERFGAGLVGNELDQITPGDTNFSAATKFEDLPAPARQRAVKRAKQYCVGVLESTESGKSQKDIDEKLIRVLEDVEITDPQVKDVVEDIEEAGNKPIPVEGGVDPVDTSEADESEVTDLVPDDN